MKKELVQQILDKYKLGSVKTLKKQDRGLTGNVFDINNKFILKLTISRSDAQRNAFACRILNKNKINAPKIIAVDISGKIIKNNYIIMNKIAGENLRDIWKNIPENEKKALFYDYGRILSKIHEIKLNKFGELINKKYQYCDWYSYISERNKTYYDYARKNKIIPDKVLIEIKDFLKDNDELLHAKATPVFIHNDFQLKNMIYSDGKIKGILDFDEVIAGHNEFDFIKTCLPFREEKIWLPQIIRGYKSNGTLSDRFTERINVYQMNFCLKVLKFINANKINNPALKKKYLWSINQIIK